MNPLKKMKLSNTTEEQINEFEKEIIMLDKFRNEYIIHFYGAVFIPNKVCMVTEFAPFGSEVCIKLRIKIMLDAANKISYLHSNGILHTEIKPDNILVARNVNLLMTNITFTKGIGTPVYMATEVLLKQKYTKSADIVSFAITIYECFKWGEAYPINEFKFPWKIAEFVMEGKRLNNSRVIPKGIYNIIQLSCKQNPKKELISTRLLTTCKVFLIHQNELFYWFYIDNY
ncbi:protein serine/threonine kinase, putative [Entamoeba invadens IP1]|uniref:Protein serine/threonine kinase, putative n=1 Tax=Entamoeba invadens IP1 TaxID=370355 RepID=A0A0A1U3F9_ENTIV|nr:protein serine/threonine kinase, putative [Entamoeba invadens IP1]ELP88586.1 protein serine/threonine kinase, putative [Entamoeba invadens IP1]|eukprot:XP_004255357.1 protein serine/threonine kinase, putative [Entamoeba invadens IP1]